MLFRLYFYCCYIVTEKLDDSKVELDCFQLPLVLEVPRLLKSDASVCLLPYSLLGFGDILVPGS